MTGIFDSGRGGVSTLAELRRLLPKEDIILLSDRINAPYGTKDRAELIRIAEGNIRHLLSLGASRVLIGCCTASTVYPYLDDFCKSVSIPIIEPIASAAAGATKNRRIGIIATEATIRSGAFRDAILSRGEYEITELALQWLVGAIEGGLSDESFTECDRKRLENSLSGLARCGIDTLILGCTHFPSVSGLISEILGDGIRLISSSYEGANYLRTIVSGEGNSITKYIAT